MISAADLAVGSSPSMTPSSGDVWQTSLGFAAPIPFVQAGAQTATVTFTVVGV